ncbi:MAG TPA: hypothetical protein VER58_16600 [Thermoanaerobaculia bacterium]|nr:hypothetical protein [Thermoanaerobaculia bacterium]
MRNALLIAAIAATASTAFAADQKLSIGIRTDGALRGDTAVLVTVKNLTPTIVTVGKIAVRSAYNMNFMLVPVTRKFDQKIAPGATSSFIMMSPSHLQNARRSAAPAPIVIEATVDATSFDGQAFRTVHRTSVLSAP